MGRAGLAATETRVRGMGPDLSRRAWTPTGHGRSPRRRRLRRYPVRLDNRAAPAGRPSAGRRRARMLLVRGALIVSRKTERAGPTALVIRPAQGRRGAPLLVTRLVSPRRLL
jgi:hypothetical protein